jgi:hypothetical protein
MEMLLYITIRMKWKTGYKVPRVDYTNYSSTRLSFIHRAKISAMVEWWNPISIYRRDDTTKFQFSMNMHLGWNIHSWANFRHIYKFSIWRKRDTGYHRNGLVFTLSAYMVPWQNYYCVLFVNLPINIVELLPINRSFFHNRLGLTAVG